MAKAFLVEFKDSVFDEIQHEQSLSQPSPITQEPPKNAMLRYIVGLEKYYDL